MEVNSDLLLLVQAGIKTDFDAAYVQAQQEVDWPKIAFQSDTTLPSQNYSWLGRGAVMELFKDEAREQGVIEYDYTLADNIYKAKLTVKRRTLEDEQYGLLKMHAMDLGSEPARFQDELVFTALESGFSNNGYDGTTFFSTTHSSGVSGTQSNKLTAALSDSALETAHTAMAGFVDDKAKPLRLVPDTLVVGPLLERRAWNLIKQDVVVTKVGDGTAGSGATASTGYGNFFNGRYNLVVSPYITGFHWFLAATKRVRKPLVLQVRSDVPPALESDIDLNSAKIKEAYDFTARSRMVAGYGLWQMMIGSQATA
jgi:phage major head subunit gpT-like protein